jgi:hypothetical protein
MLALRNIGSVEVKIWIYYLLPCGNFRFFTSNLGSRPEKCEANISGPRNCLSSLRQAYSEALQCYINIFRVSTIFTRQHRAESIWHPRRHYQLGMPPFVELNLAFDQLLQWKESMMIPIVLIRYQEEPENQVFLRTLLADQDFDHFTGSRRLNWKGQ